MKIFLSYTWRDQPLVELFKDGLPKFVRGWIDREELLWGAPVNEQIRRVIQEEIAYLIVFVAHDTFDSEWVRQELQWALARERELGRQVVLPILLPAERHQPTSRELTTAKLPDEISQRLSLRLDDRGRAAIQQLAAEASERLFQLTVNAADAARGDRRIRDLANRSQYFAEILEQIRDAQWQIVLCVRTLKPAEPGSPVHALHEALAQAKGRGVQVKLLAPAGEERALTSYQLAVLGIEHRHVPGLDVSFSLFDSQRAVLPTESGSAEETVAGITVKSRKLAALLLEVFNDLWWRDDTLTYPSFMQSVVRDILRIQPTLPIEVVSKQLAVPADALAMLLPAFARRPRPSYYFVVGRPCSGKTTFVQQLIAGLVASGTERQHIYVFNDYQVLYERFVDDFKRRYFKQPDGAADRGGFTVTDRAVLDAVLKNANRELVNGESFFEVFIVEFARDLNFQALRNFEREIVERSKVVHLKASLETCVKRNALRRDVAADHQSGFVPEQVFTEFYAHDVIDGIEALGAKVIQIDTDQVDLDGLGARAAQVLRA